MFTKKLLTIIACLAALLICSPVQAEEQDFSAFAGYRLGVGPGFGINYVLFEDPDSYYDKGATGYYYTNEDYLALVIEGVLYSPTEEKVKDFGPAMETSIRLQGNNAYIGLGFLQMREETIDELLIAPEIYVGYTHRKIFSFEDSDYDVFLDARVGYVEDSTFMGSNHDFEGTLNPFYGFLGMGITF